MTDNENVEDMNTKREDGSSKVEDQSSNIEEKETETPTKPKANTTLNPWKIVAIVTVLIMAGLAGMLTWMALTPRTITPEPIILPDETATTTEEILTGNIERQALKIDWIPLEDQVSTTSSELAMFGSIPVVESEFETGPETVTKLGVVNGGPYDMWTLALHKTEEYGMGTSYSYDYIIHAPKDSKNKSVLVSSYMFGSSGFGHDSTYERNNAEEVSTSIDVENDNGALIIPELEDYPQKISDKSGNGYILLGIGNPSENPTDIMQKHTANAVQSSFGSLAPTKLINETGDPNSFALLRKADGVPVYYDLILPFWYYGNQQNNTQFLSIKLNDRSQKIIDQEYLKSEPGGCGMLSEMHVVKIEDLGEMTVGGKVHLNSGDWIDLYVPKDFSLAHYQKLYTSWQYLNKSGTIEDFTALHPVFYYQDSLGRWVEFQSTEIIPQTECGKPVIYLYPEREMDLTVTLDPKGGFSYTEPVYNNGWRVRANPSGQLTNLDDGLTYPYLFWEGRGGVYSSPTNYWVVAQEDVNHFLTDTLGKLGLNTQETADFTEFWLPRMQSALWYKIGFHGTRVMDQIAPMSISQTPDSVLRILMDFEALDHEIPANPPRLPRTPTRNGFTVIEWGGVLQR
ncbi:MAG: hypothetical protein NUV81_00635 [bacterium]|nr:hypothetical protein [bacterium]